MRTSKDPFKQRINARNAKKVAVVLVLLFILYHGMLHISYQIDSCKWLLSDGRFQGYHVWQPYGCMLHNYSRTETRMCMQYIAYWGGHNSFVFMGDSRIRLIFQAFTEHISSRTDSVVTSDQTDLLYEDKDSKLEVRFLWRPTLNSSVSRAYQSWLDQPVSERPKIVVTGCATWSIREHNASSQSLEDYRMNLTRLTTYIDSLGTSGTRVLWTLQDPVREEKLRPEQSMITNDQLDLYNKAAIEALRYSNSRRVHVWGSPRLLSQGTGGVDSEDGLHTGQLALEYAVQTLLNMYCNDQMNFVDGTCCSDPETVTSIQVMTLSIFAIILSIAAILVLHQHFVQRKYQNFKLLVNQEDESLEMMPMSSENSTTGLEEVPTPLLSAPNRTPLESETKSYHELVVCLAKLGMIMGYAFLCDRTNLFMKENKYYTAPNFFLPIAYVFALGLFFTEESKQTKIMYQDQRDEWKGWMQLVLLTYHMTGASQVLPIYVNVRLLMTTYLFLTGYGHFTYYWQKGDHGLYRLWQLGYRYFPIYWKNKDNSIRRMLEILFRLNLLVVCLCLTMNRPYQFYHFVPVITFWFIVTHITLVTVPQVTMYSVETKPVHYLSLVVKMIVLLFLITILYMSEVLFEKIFLTRPWKALFVTTDDSIKDWWFRWKVDRYSVVAGMIFACMCEVGKRHKLLDDSNRGNLVSRGLTIAATLASVLGLCMYTAFSFLCRNQSECDEIHPYVSFVPIVSFIVLRNLFGYIRTRYSPFFAWFGKISLELFILQYHIWLAANTHGVLVLVPSYPVLNVLVTLFIFVCACHEVHSVTRKLTKYAVSSDWRYMTRNVLIFFLALIPIGIKDGMF